MSGLLNINITVGCPISSNICEYIYTQYAGGESSFILYHNGSVIASSGSDLDSTFSFSVGDTYRAIISQSLIGGSTVRNTIQIGSSVTQGDDMSIDTGTITISSSGAFVINAYSEYL